MQAIETHYLGATDKRQARIVAKCQAGKITINWDSALDVEENHDAAARKLAEKQGWHGNWVAGGKANGNGNVYVCINANVGGMAAFVLS